MKFAHGFIAQDIQVIGLFSHLQRIGHAEGCVPSALGQEEFLESGAKDGVGVDQTVTPASDWLSAKDFREQALEFRAAPGPVEKP